MRAINNANRTPGAIGADSIVACTRPFNHVFATEV